MHDFMTILKVTAYLVAALGTFIIAASFTTAWLLKGVKTDV